MTNIKKAIDKVYSFIEPLFKEPKKHFKTWLVIIGALVASWAIVFFLRTPEPTQASWWNETWLYRRAIQITNDNGEDLEDFQVAITLDTASLIAAGKMQDTCDDLRFTNINGKVLPYFQTTACNATTTRYWVKVDSISTPSTTIYVYYGNSGAPAGSNRSSTFDLSYLGTFSQTFSDANIATNHGASSDRENNFYISQSSYVNRFNTSWAYQQQYGSLDIYTGLCYDDKEDRFYGIDWSNKQWSTFTTDFVEISPMDQALGDQPIDCATDSTYVYTNHRNGKICRNKIVDNTKECIDMDALSGFDWGGQGLTYSFGYLFAGTTSSYGANGNRIYVINIDDWNDPEIVTYWDASGHTLAEVAGLTWKDKYIYQTSRYEDNANEWQGPVKVATTEPSVGAPGSEEISPGPVAYWKFDEGSGTAANDSSGQGNDGTFVSTPIWKTEEFCISGKCLSFDNIDDGVSIENENFTSLSDYTMCAWVSPKGDHKNYTGSIISSGDWNNVHWAFGIKQNNTQIQTRKADGVNSPVWNYNFPLSEWTYVCITRAATEIKAYANGQQVGSPYTGTTGNLVSNWSNTTIGKATYTSYFAFNGFIDEVKVYPYARTEEQIKSDYIAGAGSKGGAAVFGHKTETAQITPISSKLVAHWKFDEGYGEIAHDHVGGNHGTLSGTTLPEWTNEGKVDKALSFDGVDNYLTADLNVSPTETTVSFWLKNASYGAGPYLFRSNANTRTYIGINSSNNLFFTKGNPSTSIAFISNPTTNSWTHVLLKWWSDSGSLYGQAFINGKSISDSVFFEGTASGSYITVGGFSSTGGQNAAGIIDEVKIYNTALTPEEILQDYNQGAAAIMGAMGADDSGAPTQSASAEYCIPGDASHCAPPVARWDFEEGAGSTVYDASGNGNNGTLVNSPAWVTGKVGKALEFDGENEYIITESLASSPNTETLSLWLYAKDTGVIVSELGQQAINSGYHYTKIGLNTNNELKANIWNCNNDLTFGTINLNQWYFATLVYDGTAEKAYLNGEFKDSYTCSRSAPSTQYLAFAATDSQSGGGFDDTGYFQGKIDDIRLYDYARTPAQIAWDYNRGAPVGHWKFDECQGTTAHDASGNGNHGTINIGSSVPQTTVGTCSAPTDGTGAWYNGREGWINSAMSFDGVDDWVSVSDNNNHFDFGTGNFTFAAWIYKPSGGKTSPGIISKNANPGYKFNLNAGTGLYLGIYDGSWHNYVSVSGIVKNNSWQYVAITADRGGDVGYFVNGELKDTDNISGTALVNLSNSSSLLIGDDNWCRAYYCGQFDGFIDDVRIYNYALTEEQVKLLYNEGAVSFR